MRTPDQDDLPGESGSTPVIGDGFGGVSAEELSPYGDDFYDEYQDSYDEDSSSDDSDDDGSFGDDETDTDSNTDSDTTVDESDFPTDGDMSEDEAEDILEDVLEETYGDDAGEMAQELQDDSGMSALEILEDLTGLDLDGSDDASYASDYDRAMLEAAEAEAASDAATTSDLFNEDMPSESDFDLNTDGHVDRHDLDDAAEGMGFHLGQ